MKIENARTLRKRLTPQEVKIWMKLRELKKLGFHFRRQAPIGRYIVDFASFGARIVIEVDVAGLGVDDDRVNPARKLDDGSGLRDVEDNGGADDGRG